MTPEASPQGKSFLTAFAQHAWWALSPVWKYAKKLLREHNNPKKYSVTETTTYEIEVPHGESPDPQLIEALVLIRQRHSCRSLPYGERT
jgi:hypothetical protein